MKDFTAGLDTPGGHIATCFIMLGACIAAHIFFPTDQLLTTVADMAAGAMFGSMKGQNGSKVRLEPKAEAGQTTETVTETKVRQVPPQDVVEPAQP